MLQQSSEGYFQDAHQAAPQIFLARSLHSVHGNNLLKDEEKAILLLARLLICAPQNARDILRQFSARNRIPATQVFKAMADGKRQEYTIGKDKQYIDRDVIREWALAKYPALREETSADYAEAVVAEEARVRTAVLHLMHCMDWSEEDALTRCEATAFRLRLHMTDVAEAILRKGVSVYRVTYSKSDDRFEEVSMFSTVFMPGMQAEMTERKNRMRRLLGIPIVTAAKKDVRTEAQERIVQEAKAKLIREKGYDEQDAFRGIQREAMNYRVSMLAIAQAVLRIDYDPLQR